jgi:hypothetical protein
MRQDKVGELRQLLAAGYEVESINSDEECVEAVLRRGPLRISLTFVGAEATGLLTVATPALAEKRRLRHGMF